MNYKSIFDLERKGIIVTGGAGYLGSKITEGLLDFGAKVTIVDAFDTMPVGRIPDEKCANLFYIKRELSKTESVKQVYAIAEKRMGKIDVLFN